MKNKLLNLKSIDELSKYFMKILNYGIFSFFIFVFLFSRSFVGISFSDLELVNYQWYFQCLQCYFLYF